MERAATDEVIAVHSCAASALPDTTIVAAIHDRTLDHFSVPADVMIHLVAGRVRRPASETAIPSPRSSTGTEFREVR